MLRRTVSFTFFFFLLLCLTEVAGQNRLRIGPQLGANLSQIDGDSFEGFHKVGMRFGLRSEYSLQNNFAIVLELNYEDKGSFFGSHEADNKDRDKTITLDYFEVPVMLKWALPLEVPFFIEAGGSLAYLVRDEIIQEADDPHRVELLADRSKFRTTELNILVGAGWQLTDQISALLRYSYGIQALVRDDDALAEYLAGPVSANPDPEPGVVPLFHLRNYQISFGITYLFQGVGQGRKQSKLGCPTF